MAKMTGYEVIAQKPVCVDFPDGRAVSFPPGMRFEAHPTNSAVRRLLKIRDIRQLGPMERVPQLPVKLGATKDVRSILKSRRDMAEARRLAELKAKRSASAKQEPEAVDLSALNQPKTDNDDGLYESADN